MRTSSKILITVILAALFFQCEKEPVIDVPVIPEVPVIPAEPVTAAVQGNVFDETGAPAAGVTVQAGNKSAATTATGFFDINDAALDKKASLVTAAKAGYFKAYRIFGATSGANNVEIKLIKKELAGTISAVTGGELSLTNGSKVQLPANGIVNAATNAAYTGSVNVYAAYINPAAADIHQTVPGAFIANGKNGKRITLTSYGIMAVELESPTGEKLQIKAGSTAALTIAIPSSIQATAPATIALWSVDETTGTWKEEGTATKNGSVYVGNVNHFTFWSSSVSSSGIWLSMTLKNSAGDPFVHTTIRIKSTGSNWSVGGITDSLGQVISLVPDNSPLVFELTDYCGAPFYSQNIGPYAQDTNLGVVTVTGMGNRVVRIQGRLVDCNNNPVTNGYAIVSFGHFTHYAGVDGAGNFTTTFTRCTNVSFANFYITGVDASAQQPNTTAIPIPAYMNPPMVGDIAYIHTGSISTCSVSQTEFINYTLDGTNYNLAPPADSVTGSTGGSQYFTSIEGYLAKNSQFGAQFSFSFSPFAPNPGTYQVRSLGVNNISVGTPLPFNVTITTFPTTLGGFYEGSFSGQFSSGGVPHTISATFRVKRRA